MEPKLLIADARGRIRPHHSLIATGMKAGVILPLHPSELIPLPAGSRLFMMPSRRAVGLDPRGCAITQAGPGGLAVSAFLPPGYAGTYSAAFAPRGTPKPLPLYAYAACASYKDRLYAAALRVDTDRRHDSTRINIARVRAGIKKIGKLFPKNRLIPHLEQCALTYGCCGAQNFFLSAYECPLPSSMTCNSSCAGCISKQSRALFPATQPRISFTPSPDELAEIALYHIGKVPDTVVSFGQGCEGEPLMAAAVIEEAIRIIRKKTGEGVINMNTNASRPEAIKRLAKAGLDSIRVSINSAREDYYRRYYHPRGYSFHDVMQSIRIMKKARGFVSLNYLTMPGFTDTLDEFAALRRLIRRRRIDMIQWRNLNYDPLLYFAELKIRNAGPFMGIRHEIGLLREEFPRLMHGYFNPTRTQMKKRGKRP